MARQALAAAALLLLVALVFARAPATEPALLDLWTPVRGTALTRWLPDPEFEAAARRYGQPPTIGGFAVWHPRRHWWRHDEIYLRARRLDLFAHEARHIEQRRNFHAQRSAP